MNGTIDDRYLEWLYGLVGSVRNRNPARSFWGLARLLYTKEFVWLVPNDDNRVEDGKSLRQEFIDENGFDEIDSTWIDLGCSMLELFIGLARHASFETGLPVSTWFWIFMRNLKLEIFMDSQPLLENKIDGILDRVIYRTYRPDGYGGIFPLKNICDDQRKVELWYQMAAYIIETMPA